MEHNVDPGRARGDPELVHRIQAHDVDAEGELWQKYEPRVVVLLFKKTRSTEENIDDLKHEVFMAFQRAARAGRIVRTDCVGPFIIGIARRKAADWIRDRVKAAEREQPIEVFPEPRTEENPETHAIEKEDREGRDREWRRVRQALRQLRWIDRQIILLRFHRKWSYREIVAFLDRGLNEASARKRVSRAFRWLRAQQEKA